VLAVTAACDDDLLERVRGIARAAGDAILQVYRTEFSVEHKDDLSPLTEADRASHAIIRDGLAALVPRLPLLSEEAEAAEHAERRSWSRYWLVDPLDGTKEFVKRNGEFTVNVALIDGHRPVLGVVLAPAIELEYSAIVGRGAYRSRAGGERRPIEVRLHAPVPLRVVGSRSHPSPGLAAFLEAVGEHEMKPMGSSLKICLVAEGAADVYPRLGPTSEWDTAAAQAILEAAGGSMIDLGGRPLRYNTKQDLLNPHFLAFGDRSRDWLAAFRKD
jgi:3'(2'), 5'-bisphosphate nucleotidase